LSVAGSARISDRPAMEIGVLEIKTRCPVSLSFHATYEIGDVV
jgi:hypothetical protein